MTDEIDLFITKSDYLKRKQIVGIDKLQGDASSREFFRIKLFDNKSIILMKFAEGTGPLHLGEIISQTASFLEIAPYLLKNKINVPKIIEDNHANNFSILEDLGDDKLSNHLDDVNFNKFFYKALNLLKRIQELEDDKSIIIFKRKVNYQNLLDESLRFIKFFTPNTQINTDEALIIEKNLEKIALQVSTQKQVPTFRDYIAWNIMIRNDELFLVDFQDIAIGAYTYDLVSLLHDRDTDLILGDNILNNLIGHFYLKSNTFKEDYYYTLLQRHFRLAGQFLNLTKITGKEIYSTYVPNTLIRIGRALGALGNEFKELVDILSLKIPEIKEGVKKPYEFDFK